MRERTKEVRPSVLSLTHLSMYAHVYIATICGMWYVVHSKDRSEPDRTGPNRTGSGRLDPN